MFAQLRVHYRLTVLVLVVLAALVAGFDGGSWLGEKFQLARGVTIASTSVREAATPAHANASAIAAVNLQLVGYEYTARTIWDNLADCESGNWDRRKNPILGSARWDYGIDFSHGDFFEGGLNFHPGTWDAYRDSSMASHAGRATRFQQIEVAERVLDDQGWGAWPACSRKLGLR